MSNNSDLDFVTSVLVFDDSRSVAVKILTIEALFCSSLSGVDSNTVCIPSLSSLWLNVINDSKDNGKWSEWFLFLFWLISPLSPAWVKQRKDILCLVGIGCYEAMEGGNAHSQGFNIFETALGVEEMAWYELGPDDAASMLSSHERCLLLSKAISSPYVREPMYGCVSNLCFPLPIKPLPLYVSVPILNIHGMCIALKKKKTGYL